MLLFVFFKQKTAYEMRISDWSSDVCSSDLATPAKPLEPAKPDIVAAEPAFKKVATPPPAPAPAPVAETSPPAATPLPVAEPAAPPPAPAPATGKADNLQLLKGVGPKLATLLQGRSEEHTSELQSLMRISYAVFCLKKKNKYTQDQAYTTTTTT